MYKDKSALLILGGLRIGDTAHCIPILNRLKSMGFKNITWLTGTYEQSIAMALGQIYNITVETYNDGFPTDIHSRENFLKAVETFVDQSKYDYVYKNFKGTFEFETDLNFTLEETYLPKSTPLARPPYIVVQADSVTKFKAIDGLFCVDFPREVICVGGKSERRIPGGVNMMGAPWIDVIRIIQSAELYVGIHSAATCAAFYTGTPMIVCDLGKNFDFSKQGHGNIVQLYDRPSRDEIQRVIDEFYKR